MQQPPSIVAPSLIISFEKSLKIFSSISLLKPRTSFGFFPSWKYFAVLNNKLSYTTEGSDVIIDGENFSQADALKQIVNASSFTISGPEDDRITVGFEEHGAGFRLFAAAKDGVVSGHGIRLADSNSAAQKSIFHLDHNLYILV